MWLFRENYTMAKKQPLFSIMDMRSMTKKGGAPHLLSEKGIVRCFQDLLSAIKLEKPSSMGWKATKFYTAHSSPVGTLINHLLDPTLGRRELVLTQPQQLH
jgi:hypothetical protein